MSYDYDLVVIGGGPGGYTGAIRAAKLGMKVALAEYRELGGTCLNRGCIPTKALLHSSALYGGRADWTALGVNAENVSFDEAAAYAHKDEVVSTLRGGIQSLLKTNGVEVYCEKARLKDAHTVAVGEREITTEYVLIATGSRPARLPIVGIDSALNSDAFLGAPTNGESYVIIGGGVIGVEFAQYLLDLGKSVTIVEAMDRILPMMSKELSLQLASVLKKKGAKLLSGKKVKAIGEKYVIIEEPNGESQLDCDRVIVSIGRSPNVEDIGLAEVGVEVSRFVRVDDDMRTSVPNIFACGDVNGRCQLAHYAAASAIAAVEVMKGNRPSVNLGYVPSCVYTTPAVATIGSKGDFEGAQTGKFLMGANGKSLIEGVNRGYVKTVANADGVLVGAEIFAVDATEIIGELTLAVASGMKAKDVASVIHAHPTVYEAIGESVESIFGMATHIK